MEQSVLNMILLLQLKKNDKIITDYEGTVVLDTGVGSGNWFVKEGDANNLTEDLALNDGKATYKFTAADQGVATFQLLYAGAPNEIDVEVYDEQNTYIRDDDTSGTIKFFLFGYIISENPFVTPQLGEDPLLQTYSATQEAGKQYTMHITAYGADDSGECDVRDTYYEIKDLSFWQDYIDPDTGTKNHDCNWNY